MIGLSNGFSLETPIAADLDGMTKAELLNYAADNGVDSVDSSMKKADILAIIKNA